MEVGRVTSATQVSAMAAPQGQELSSTDWKVYAKVVLSYMLIGIGIALACSSIYIAFALSPMIAATSPITPIAAGVLLLDSTEPKMEVKVTQTAKLPSIEENPPIGIANPRGGNCWINALLQLLFNVPAYRKVMENLSKKSELSDLRSAFKIYKNGGEVNSQVLREWLCKNDPNVDPSESIQDDPFLFLLPVLSKSGYCVAKEIENSVVDNKCQKTNLSAPSACYYLNLAFPETEAVPTLSEGLDRYFYTSENLSSGEKRKTIHDLDRIPDDFSIAVHRGGDDQAKKKMQIKGAMEVSLNGNHIGKDTLYYPDGFICHEGDSVNYGHYVAYLFKAGSWWKVSDSSAQPISLEKATKMIEQAVLIHYQKVPSPVQS